MASMKQFTLNRPTTSRAVATLVAAIALLGLAIIVDPLNDTYLATASIMAIAIVGLSLLIGLSGQVSIGNSGFMAIGAFTTAIWAQHHAHFPILGSMALSVVVSTAAGIVLGLPSTRLRGPYLAGMTLAFAFAIPPFIQSLGTFAGGSGGLYFPTLQTPAWFASAIGEKDNPLAANNTWGAAIAIVVAAVAFFFMANFFHSRSGRAMRLVRDNDVAAELVGVNVARTRVLAFAISAAFAGLAGSLLALVQSSVLPQTFGVALSIELLSLLVLGGLGTLGGAMIAGLIAAYSDSIVSRINSWTGIDPVSNLGGSLKGIIFGLILVATMLLAPSGLAGLGHRISRFVRSRFTKKKALSVSETL